jgi:hypothetical protein
MVVFPSLRYLFCRQLFVQCKTLFSQEIRSSPPSTTLFCPPMGSPVPKLSSCVSTSPAPTNYLEKLTTSPPFRPDRFAASPAPRIVVVARRDEVKNFPFGRAVSRLNLGLSRRLLRAAMKNPAVRLNVSVTVAKESWMWRWWPQLRRTVVVAGPGDERPASASQTGP